jgi:hypothetical protein
MSVKQIFKSFETILIVVHQNMGIKQILGQSHKTFLP